MKKTGKCKTFGLDLMHLSTNELDEVKDQEALKTHLKGCKKCRAKLAELNEVAVFTFLAGPRSDKYKAGMKKLLKRAKCVSSECSGNQTKKDNGCK